MDGRIRVERTRIRGHIITPMVARKEYKCAKCGLPIKPKRGYCEIVKGGGGLGWLKFPDRVHPNCLAEYLRTA